VTADRTPVPAHSRPPPALTPLPAPLFAASSSSPGFGGSPSGSSFTSIGSGGGSRSPTLAPTAHMSDDDDDDSLTVCDPIGS